MLAGLALGVHVIQGQLEPSAPIAAGVASTLNAVACTSPTACVAVGSYQGREGGTEALVERFGGQGWSLEEAPSPGSDAVLRSVACPEQAWCLAVGAANTSDPARQRGLLELWDGQRWSVGAPPLPPPPSSFQSVECDSAAACRAVGWSSASGSAAPFVGSWDGRAWSLTSLPFPGQGATDGAFLMSIACPAPRSCLATGLLSTNDGGDGTATLVEEFAAGAWEVLDSPSPEVLTGDMSSLQAIACAAADACFAAGFYARGNVFNSAYQALIERWSGGAWKLVTGVPLDPRLQSDLAALACPSPTICVAAGWTTDSAQRARGLVEEWNGRSWSALGRLGDAGPWPGLSCPGPGICLLVGQSQAGGDALGHASAAWWRAQPPR